MSITLETLNQEVKEATKEGTITFNCSKPVNEMLDDWIETAKLLGEKYKVKEYKQLKKELNNN